jgi:hypothetical protein
MTGAVDVKLGIETKQTCLKVYNKYSLHVKNYKYGDDIKL